MKRTIFLLMLGLAFTLWGQEQTGSFTLEVTGQKTWTISYGIGDPGALASEGLYPGQLSLDQSLRADITGTALGFLTLEANFDDQLGPGFQHFVLKLEQPPWRGLLGDFYVGRGELGVYNKKLLGVKVSYEGDTFTVSALGARLEGISESRTFRGQAAQAEITFSYHDPEQPWLPAPYAVNLDGPYFWPLKAPFVEGFSQPKLILRTDGLDGYLVDYGLGYLMEVLAEQPGSELAEGAYLVLRDTGDVLLLKSPPDGILRNRIREAIDAYNDLHGLAGQDRKRYPFVTGGELERAFLQGLEAYAQVELDQEVYPFAEAGRRRYLLLGEKDVIEDSLAIELLPPGADGFRPIDDPAFADYSWDLYPEEGVIKIQFPEEFFGDDAAVHVTFRYQRAGDVFMLGLSVVPGSERVYLNGEPLTRGTDYTIDYETGMLVLFVTLTEDDELKVDFERQRGGLGGYAEYERVFLGGTLSVPGYEDFKLSLWRALDLGKPGPTTRTMPNTHTVAALSMEGESAGWQYSLSFGASENVFPPGDNERIAAPNRVNDIALLEALDGQYVVFAHQNGLTVYHSGTFSSYAGAQGLGGRAVRALLALPEALLCATDAGLTVVKLADPAPFDRVASWVRIYPEDGLPGKEAFALTTDGDRIYLATDESLASFPPDSVEEPEEWDTLPLPEGGGRPRTLVYTSAGLLLGTEEALYRWAGTDWERIPDVSGPVYDLLEADGALYVATGQGVRVLREGTPAGWLTIEESYALTYYQGEIWWGTPSGLYRESSPEVQLVGRVTALAGDGALWVGTEAVREGGAYTMDLWRLSPTPERFPQTDTHIDGRDLGHFIDALAAQHTARGITGSLRLSRAAGDWDLTWEAVTRWPGYQAIGATGGGDGHGLGFTAHYRTQTLSGTLSGHWEVRELFSDPKTNLQGALEATWQGLPTVSISFTPAYSPAEGRLEAGYRLGAVWKVEGWSGDLSLAGRLTGPDWYIGGKLNARLNWQLTADLELEARLAQPYRSRGTPGETELSLSATWTGGVEGLSWKATASSTFTRGPSAGGWTPTCRTRVELRWSPWAFEGGKLTPTATVELSQSQGETGWDVVATGLLQLGKATWRLNLAFGQGYRPASQRLDRDLSLSLRWEYRGWDAITPTLNWKRTWQLLSHPCYGEKITEKTEATLRVSWRPDAPWRNDLTLNYKGTGGVSLTDRLSWPLEEGTISAQASATWKGGKLEGKLLASYGRPLAEGWDLSGELGYAFGSEPGEGINQGLFGQLSLVATF